MQSLLQPPDVSQMAINLHGMSLQCRLLLRKSSGAFAERKTTLNEMITIGLAPLRFKSKPKVIAIGSLPPVVIKAARIGR